MFSKERKMCQIAVTHSVQRWHQQKSQKNNAQGSNCATSEMLEATKFNSSPFSKFEDRQRATNRIFWPQPVRLKMDNCESQTKINFESSNLSAMRANLEKQTW
jgi:hypothetical protein